MSSAIDRRIVEMQFDNKDFERNIETSQKSLEKLKESLDLDESAKSLDALEKAGKKFNLDHVADAAEVVKNKFSVLGTIGDQILRRMTNAAYDMFSKLKGYAAMFTIDPIHTGFQEYETQIGAIQTIMSNTRWEIPDNAERLSRVNEQLDILNHYADQTIYNFTQMTESIGRFTAAGVGLDTSVSAIKGISNMAALLGARPDQASSAMYMFSQAISSGKMMAYQYNSLMHSGMQGKQFEDAILRAAKAHKTSVTVSEGKKKVQKNVYDWISSGGISLKDSLQHGWLTDDLLLEVLDQFSWGDFSQMTDEIRNSVTDENRQSIIDSLVSIYTGGKDPMSQKDALDKAHKLVDDATTLTKEDAKEIKKAQLLAQGYKIEDIEEMFVVAEEAQKAATQVKTFTQLIDVLKEAAQSGWTETWRYIAGDFEQAKELFTGLSDYFGEIIGDSANARNALMKEWSDRGGRGMLFNKDTDKGPLGALWNMIYGIRNLISAVKDEFRKIVPPATAETLLSITERIRDVTARFYEWTQKSENMDRIRKIVAGIANAFGIVSDAVGSVWRWFKSLFSETEETNGGFLGLLGTIGDWITNLRTAIKESEVFQKILGFFSPIIKTVTSVVTTTVSTVLEWINKLWTDFSKLGSIGDVLDFIKGMFVALWTRLKESKIGEWISSLWNNIKSSKIGEWVTNLWNKIKASKFAAWITELWTKIKTSKFAEWVSGLWDKIKGTGIFEKLGEWFGNIGVKLSELWAKVKTTKFSEWISTLWRKITGSGIFEKLGVWIGKVWGWISDLWAKLKGTGIFEKIGGWISSLWSKIQGTGIFEKLGGWFGTLSGWITDLWNKIRSTKLGKAIEKFFTLDTRGAGSIFDKLRARFEMFAMTLNLDGILKQVKEKIRNFFDKIFAFIRGDKISGLNYAGKASDLSSMKSGPITSLLEGMLGPIDEKSIFGKISSIYKDVFSSIINFFKNLFSNFADTGFGKALGKAGGFVADNWKWILGFGGAFFGGKMVSKRLKEITRSFRGISGGFSNLSAAVRNLTKDGFDLQASSKGLMIKKNGPNAGKTPLSEAILKIALAIGVLAASIYVLGTMDKDSLVRGLLVVGGLLAGIVIMSKLMSKTGFDGKGIFNAALGVVILAGAILLFSVMKPTTILKGLICIGIVLTMLAVFTRMASKKQVGNLIGVAASLLVFVFVMKRLAAMDFEQFGEGLLRLGALMLEVAVFSRIVSKKQIKSLVGVAVSLLLLVGVMKALAKMSWSNMGKAFVGLGILLLEVGVFSRLAKGTKIKSAIGLILMLAAGLGLMILAFKSLENSNMGDFVAFAVSLSLLFASLSIAIAVLSKIPVVGSLKALANFSIFMVGLGGLMVLVGWISSKWSGMSGLLKKGATTLADIAEGVGEIVGAIAKGALKRLGLDLEEYASSTKNLANVDETGADKATAIALKMKEFTDALPEEEFWIKMNPFSKSKLKIFSEGLGAFGKALGVYCGVVNDENLKPVDPEKTALLIAAAGEVATFSTETDFPTQSGLQKLLDLPTDFEQFIESLPKFAQGVADYSTIIESITNLEDLAGEGKTGKLIAAAESLANFETMTKVPEQDNWGKLLDLPTDFEQFCQSLPTFASSMADYASIIVSIENLEDLSDDDQSKTSKLVAAAKSLAAFENMVEVPHQDNWGKLLDLPTDFEQFCQSLPTFGSNMADYASAIIGIENLEDLRTDDQSKTSKIIAAATSLAAFENMVEVPHQDNWGKLLDLPTDFEIFCRSLPTFGRMMAKYATALKGIDNLEDLSTDDSSKASKLIAAATSVANFQTMTSIEHQDNWGKLLDLPTDFEQFCQSLPTFGSKMNEYINAINGITLTNLTQGKSEAIVTAATSVIDLAKSLMPEEGSEESAAGYLNYLTTAILDDLIYFGEQFELFGQYTSTAPTIQANIANIRGIMDDLLAISSDESYNPDNFDYWRVNDLLEKLKLVKIPAYDMTGVAQAKEFMDTLASAINTADNINNIETSAVAVSVAGASAVKTTYKDWSSAGAYLGMGIGAGLRSQKSYVVSIARDMAASAAATVRAAWLIRSPSRVGQELGMYFDLGIANGLSEYSRVVGGNAAEMSQSVVDSASTMLTGVDTSIFDGLDPNPTIRPVMDLTNVQNGVGAINGMLSSDNFGGLGLFGGKPTLRGINALNLEGGRITGSFTDKNIVERLDGLQSRMGDLSEAITNMQIVLDSGALVGATTSLIDDSLGTLAMRKGRGN